MFFQHIKPKADSYGKSENILPLGMRLVSALYQPTRSLQHADNSRAKLPRSPLGPRRASRAPRQAATRKQTALQTTKVVNR
jgi:hypothetical protein